MSRHALCFKHVVVALVENSIFFSCRGHFFFVARMFLCEGSECFWSLLFFITLYSYFSSMNATLCSGVLSYTKFCASNLRSLDHNLSASCSDTSYLTYVSSLKCTSQASLGMCSSSTDRRNVIGGSFCRYPFGRRNVVGPAFFSVDTYTCDGAALESSAHVVEEVGVLLLGLGGPETLNDVQPLLYNLFADPDINRLPRLFRFFQRPLAQLISVLRAPKSKGMLLLEAGLLYERLHTSREDAYLSSLPVSIINSWYQRKGYIKSMADLIEKELQSFPEPKKVMAFFSAHGVPVSYVEDAGDPYRDQIEECIFLIMQELKNVGINNKHTLAYQSRVGPVQWLKLYTDEVIVELDQNGIRSLLAVPISFVSEHIETLEIDMEYEAFGS